MKTVIFIYMTISMTISDAKLTRFINKKSLLIEFQAINVIIKS